MQGELQGAQSKEQEQERMCRVRRVEVRSVMVHVRERSGLRFRRDASRLLPSRARNPAPSHPVPPFRARASLVTHYRIT